MILLLISTVYAHTWDSLVGYQVNEAAQKLYDRLTAVHAKGIFSGQCDSWDQLTIQIGKTPIIQGFDLSNYSPHNPMNNWQAMEDGTIQKAIDWHTATKGVGIVTLHWNWYSPIGGALNTQTYYTHLTDFNVELAVKAGTAENKALLRDIDAIAIQLKRLLAKNIPVLWRPFHEAEGGWFWWGQKGYKIAKLLYQIMYDRFNYQHRLNNIIWVWSSTGPTWYPGKDFVDIIGVDLYLSPYNYQCNLIVYEQLKEIVKGTKLVALTVTGPIPNIDACFKETAYWSYFMSWSDLVLSQNDAKHLSTVYNDNRVKTLENCD